MPHYQKLLGTRCYLSPCSPEDAALWAQWDNDLGITIPLGDEAYLPAGLDVTYESITTIVKQRQHIFSILDLATGTVIGRALFFDIDHVNQGAMVGLVIGDRAYWGKGYGFEAMQLLLDYGFNLLNLHNIMLGVFAFNQRALRLYQKLGFREIGRRRQARMIAGQRHDVIFMDLLATEFVSPYVQRLIAE